MNYTAGEVKWYEVKKKKKRFGVEDFHFPAAKPCYSKA